LRYLYSQYMADLHKIRASGEVAGHTGEIRTTLRETRIAALRSHLRLPETAGIVLLYSLLYDPETRVRAIAQDKLSELTVERVNTFIRESGHPRVLDIIAHNTEKDSPVLKAISAAPLLARRTRDYLDSMGITACEQVPSPIDAAESPPGETSGADDRKGIPSSSDIDLPEGVEFSMPTDEEPAALEDTAPPPPKSEDESPRERKPHPPRERPVVEPPAEAETPATERPTNKLFPGHEAERKEAAHQSPSTPQAPRKTTAAVASVPEHPAARPGRKKAAGKPDLKRDLALAIIAGVLIGAVLALAFILIDRFVPDWPQRLKNVKEILQTRSLIEGGGALFACNRPGGGLKSRPAGKKQEKDKA